MLIFAMLLWVLPALIYTGVASSKHRSAVGWFFLGLLFSWIAVLVIAAVGPFPPRAPKNWRL